jgi:hypothetical protein
MAQLPIVEGFVVIGGAMDEIVFAGRSGNGWELTSDSNPSRWLLGGTVSFITMRAGEPWIFSK